MGGLATFDLKGYIDSYDIKTFIETGVGFKGWGVIHSQKYDFEDIISVDIDKIYYEKAVEQFKDDKRVKVHFGKSVDMLGKVLPLKTNILFWLDAHFPETYLEGHFDETIAQGKDYISKIPESTRLPVEYELEVIVKKQDISNSVFIIDDYRCYEPESGNFGFGKHQNRHLMGCTTDSAFFDKLLGETHDIVIDRRHSGYLIATPKENKVGTKEEKK